MEGELVTAIVAISTAFAGVLGYIGKELKTKYEDRQASRRAVPELEPPGGNGRSKYVTRERLEEHCAGQLHVIATKFDAVSKKQDEHAAALNRLTETIFEWKDDAVEKLADHGARIGSLERNHHGARG